MVTITVDDYSIQTESVVNLLKVIEPTGVHLSAASGSEALGQLTRIGADVVFLDIEMPGMNGLEAAERIRDISPKTNIVFITGHSEYALQAFGVYASGYLLKPIDEKQLREALANLRYLKDKPHDKRIKVRCFGQFEAWFDGEPIRVTRTRTKALLAYLIDRQGAMCGTDQLICAVWPEGTVSATYSSRLRTLIFDLQTTLTMLGMGDAVFRGRGTVGINTAMVDCDYYNFLRGDTDAVRLYNGEYMTQYEFAEETRYNLQNGGKR